MVVRLSVPSMLDKKSGSVINMASIGGVVAVRERLAYTTTKFAVVGLTKSLALDHSHTWCSVQLHLSWREWKRHLCFARLKRYPDPQAAYRDMAATSIK